MRATGSLGLIPLLAALLLALGACAEPFGPRANLHDTEGTWVIPASSLLPADGETTADTTPLLDWADVEGAASYEVQIAREETQLVTAAPATTAGSSYAVPAELPYGRWHWRARAVNGDGMPALWSLPSSFLVDLEMVSVAGGSFSMGSTAQANELPVHAVTLTGFLVGRYEVTQAQYAAVMGSNPSAFTGDDLRPVESVTWYEAVAFCNALSSLGGLDPSYTIDGTSVSLDLSKNGYRLPTEAEWEYAARGGVASHGYTYAGANGPEEVAWYDVNSGGSTHAVGIKASNELGIHDMSGNVWEWCWDWYGSYGATAQTDPTGAASGTARIARGGSYFTGIDYLRCTDRDYVDPAEFYNNIGFRVVRRGG